ncbi:amino acid ABC transporter membrane protein, PAAT family [Intrasporangium calvum DSM 43043]|uniref:Amino acid ABC transporter membrane protein, PAAT family n=1 Tax=Intrasporangium calvum (strain ATCC 23552 / DSM 43043 / JCM 3097 / NBRC 12989 / NCIMB 10167 / NRRL B-3866 / 7 KIP) TaxID=710696 RepID=E6S643_INTC7|nr:amino acid ABC transporter membrane protein, PAAT family [Intrasporangium calvum DSM 43043]AXG12049.1 amino acid ABC transporter permease [Intrasporangium calvum]AXG15146.1 amino acid ABC transporter permease [Intrasporangium calvum]
MSVSPEQTPQVSLGTEDRPGAIHARPVPHPWRWVALAAIAVVVAMVASSFLTNERWNFPQALRIMNFNPVLEGLLKGTLLGTAGAMVLGVVFGVAIAVMRLSANPVLRGVSFVFTWFFRAIPRYVLLVMMGSIGYLYPDLALGLPFGQQLAESLGWGTDLTFATVDVNRFSTGISTGIFLGIIGLGLSEAAYMAEIARAGILSVDKGQAEAAQALGMSSGKTMRRIVLPQAMRVIVPPTGNETIAMVKDTSLLTAIPVQMELFNQTRIIGTRTLQIMPSLVAAVGWYLIVCSVLMVGQYYLERYFGRGFGETRRQARKAQAKRAARPAGMGGA